MKKLKWIFGIVLIVTVFAGLFVRNFNKDGVFERTEFLFDTSCTVSAYGENAQAAVDAVFERLGEIHKKTDFFSESSEVFSLNSAKADEKVSISDDLAKIFEVAMEVQKASGGSFDPTVAAVVELWNFSGEGRIPEEAEIAEKLSWVGGELLSFEGKNTVKKSADGVKADLGGAAKGYAGDEAIRILKEYNVSGAVVDLGGNITCMGENPKTENKKWRIGLQKPFSPTGEIDGVVELSEGAVVTSGTYQRYFEKDGKKYHHIIDPKTGYPSKSPFSSVTVVAKNGLTADCLATACFVLGEEKGRELAERYGAEIYFTD